MVVPPSIVVVAALCLFVPAGVYGTVWQVFVGGGSGTVDQVEKQPWFTLRYYPDAITIVEGDWVQFTFRTELEHQVVFSNNTILPLLDFTDFSYNPLVNNYPDPATNSSINPNKAILSDVTATLSSGTRTYLSPDYWVQFPTAGEYMYYCLFHAPGMKANISVVSASNSSSLNLVQPLDQYMSVLNEMDKDRNVTVSVSQSMNLDLYLYKPNVTQSSDGQHWNYTVITGVSTLLEGGYMAEADRFYPYGLIINVGDTVTFDVSLGSAPHVVAFNGSGIDTVFAEEVIPKQNGKFGLNPVYGVPTSNLLGSNSSATSGLLESQPLQPGAPVVKTWSVTFGDAGLYRYVCILHDQAGMIGEILVMNGTAPAPSPSQIMKPKSAGHYHEQEATGLVSSSQHRHNNLKRIFNDRV